MDSKKVIGYVGINNLSKMKEEDIKCLDVINLAFGVIEDGTVVWDYKRNEAELERIRALNPQIKIVLSIGGWGADGFSQAASSEEGRKKFADSAVSFVKECMLDGLDIDWEYPCIGVAGIQAHQDDKTNFTLLLKTLRETLDEITGRTCMLTIAAGGDTYYLRCTEMDKIIDYLDYVQLMSYDLRGGFTVTTGHHTNLYTNQADLHHVSTDYTVKKWIAAGVPKEKIVIEAAFYSRIWKGVPNRDNGFMQMAETTGTYGPDYGDLVESYINKNGFVRFWDDEAKAPYLFNGDTFISYDDEESIAHKAAYVKEQGLGGMMYWEYQCDATYTLTKWIAEKIK